MINRSIKNAFCYLKAVVDDYLIFNDAEDIIMLQKDVRSNSADYILNFVKNRFNFV